MYVFVGYCKYIGTVLFILKMKIWLISYVQDCLDNVQIVS